MKFSETKWFLYTKENYHKFIVWFVFFFLTTLLIILTIKIIDGIGKESNGAPNVKPDEVKIYFQKSTPDSLLNVLKGEIDGIQRTLESMQQDSITVSVQKVTK